MQATHDSYTGNSSSSASKTHPERHYEDMKGAQFVVNHNLRTLAKSISTLAKISEDVHIEVTDAGLFFKVVHRSKYCVFRFAPEFFNSCDVSMINNKHVNMCRLSMKTAQRIFKGVSVSEKNFVGCEFRIDPKAEKMIVNLQMNHDINRIIHARLREMSNVLQKPVYDRTSCRNTSVVSASALSPILAQMKNDVEVTLKVDKNGITIRNFHSAYGFTMFNGSELKGSGKKVKTETTIGVNTLTRHTVTVPSEFSFSFREFLSVVQFAEQLTSEICLSYDLPGRPLIVTIETHPNFDVELALPTMGNDDEVDLDGGIITETLARVEAEPAGADLEITHVSNTNSKSSQQSNRKKSVVDELDIVSSSGSQPKRGPVSQKKERNSGLSRKTPEMEGIYNFPSKNFHWDTTVHAADRSWRANEIIEREEPVRITSDNEEMEMVDEQPPEEAIQMEEVYQADLDDNVRPELRRDRSVTPNLMRHMTHLNQEQNVQHEEEEPLFVDDIRNEQYPEVDEEPIFRAPEPKRQKNTENRNKKLRCILLGTTRKEQKRMEDHFSGSPFAMDTQF